MVEELLKGAIEKFEERIKADENLQQELDGITRTVQVEVTDGDWYSFTLDNKEVKDFGTQKIENADIRIIADTETINQLFKGELKPMKAFATKKLQVKASISDMLRLKKFF